MRYSQGSAPIR